MKKVIKWVAIVGGAVIVLVIAALLIVPMFIDVQKYKPQIEEKVSEATGRPFAIDGELNLSLFPWVGLGFSGLHLGNPQGFQEKDFVSIKSFEVRVKLFPLLSKDIQVKRFILEEPRIVLEKSKKGKGNWEGIGKPSEPSKEKKEIPEDEPGEGLPIAALTVNEFAITKGSVIFIDHGKGERQEISDLTLRLKDVTLDRPIPLVFSANLDGRPLSLKGKVGPLGKEPGKGTIPLDLAVKALKQIDMSLKGKIVDPATHPRFDLAVQISPFSPRKLVAALGQTFPITTTDPKALNLVALKAKLKGDPGNVSISDGALELDDSKLDFSAKAKDFSKPDLTFNLNLDKIDLDRYLPPPSEKSAEEKKMKKEEQKAKAPAPKKKKTDYTPLRRLVLDGTIRIGSLKAHGAKIQDLYMKVSGKNGRFNLNPLTLKLYQGDASAKGAFDVSKNIPKSNMNLQMKGVQAGPLLGDLLKKDFLEGTLKADVGIRMKGDDAERIKKTLNGKGDFLFKDGAIKGIDLA
jgi:AsmA protein